MTDVVEETPLVNPEPRQTESVWAALEAWAQEVQPWQRFILTVASREGQLSATQVEQAYQLFLQENSLIEATACQVPIPTSITERPLQASDQPIMLSGISNLRNVNALPEVAQLTFGTGLTVIYGPNGAGKSGFVRVLANVCFSRNKPQIHPNIYDETENPSPQADISVSDGTGADTVYSFDGVAEHPILKRFSVFDTEVAKIHLSGNNSFSFKPSGFDVFNEMARVYALLGDKLAADIQQRQRAPEFSNSFLAPSSTVSAQVAALGPDSDLEALKTLAVYGAVEQARLTEITQQVEELKRQGVAETLNQLGQAKSDLDGFSQRISILLQPLRRAAKEGYAARLQDYREKHAAAARMGSEQFQRSFFQAVGSPVWESFLMAARALGQAEHPEYPLDTDHCLLCQRSLDPDSAALIRRFWEFLASTARSEADQAKQTLVQQISVLKALPFELLPADSRVRSHLAERDPALLERTDTFLRVLAQERDTIIAVLEGGLGDIPLAEPDSPANAYAGLLAQILVQETQLRQMNVEQTLQLLEAERVTLRHREVLSQMIGEVETFVLEQRWIRTAGQARQSLNTRSITAKQKQLFESVVGIQYRQALQEECQKLRCRFPLEMDARGSSGETVRSLSLSGGYRPHDILSEGEQRAVALADFLTEVRLNPASAGIILDDPVTSQDHERKRLIADRLVEEAAIRQVVVFTHDLVFLTQLCNGAKDNGLIPLTHWVQRDGEDLPGLVTLEDCPVTTEKYLNADLARRVLANARTSSGSSQVELVRQGMAILRRTVEEIIPVYLFKKVVNKWTDRVMVTALPKVNWDQTLIADIVQAFEDLSGFLEGHSHPDESAGSPPTVQDLSDMIDRVHGLIGRAKPERPRVPVTMP